MSRLKIVIKYFFGIFFVVAGLNHFVSPPFYLKIMPSYLPWHLFLVYLSGLFEIAFGVLLLVPRCARLAAWGLIALLLAVFPANIHMATHPELYAEINPALLYLRLPLQFVLIAWAYLYTRPDARRTANMSPARGAHQS